MADDNDSPGFRSHPWVKVVRWTVPASVVLSAATVGYLYLNDPPKNCPAWQLRDETDLWFFFVFWTAPLLAGAGYMALRWDQVAQKSAQDANNEMRSMFGFRLEAPAVPVVYVLIGTCLAASAMAQLPLFLLVTQRIAGW